MRLREPVCGTHPPRFDAPIDLEEHVRALPPRATCKGLFLRDPLKRVERLAPGVDVFREARIQRRRILHFKDYPYEDFMRILVASSEVLYPRKPLGEGLRRLGRAGYEAMLSHQIGKVLFAAFDRDFGRIASIGARGWGVSMSFGEVRYEDLGPNHGVYHFERMPAFLETYQVGVVEGAMAVCGVRGEVWANVEDLRRGTLEFWWD